MLSGSLSMLAQLSLSLAQLSPSLLYDYCHYHNLLLMQFRAKYQVHPVGSHEAKIKSHPVSTVQIYSTDP